MAQWETYFAQEPMTDHFWIGAQICQVLANLLGSGKKTYTLEKFLPIRFGRRHRSNQTVQESLESVREAMGE